MREHLLFLNGNIHISLSSHFQTMFVFSSPREKDANMQNETDFIMMYKKERKKLSSQIPGQILQPQSNFCLYSPKLSA